MTELLLAAVQVGVLFLAAPLLAGLIRSLKAGFQLRSGPSPLQPYRDLAKLWRKGWIESEVSGPVQRLAPAVVLAAVAAAALLVPTVVGRAPLAGWGDLLAVVGLLALARLSLAAAALDTGSAFGGMGSSREVSIAALIEPGLVLAVVGVAVRAGSTDVSAITSFGLEAGSSLLTPGHLLMAAAFLVVLIGESGHLPVDNPDTHLELTMVHEGMVLELSGRQLALVTYAAQLKQALLVALFVAVFVPWGAAAGPGILSLVLGLGAFTVKMAAGGLFLGMADAAMPKLRILRLPELLGAASLLALTGLAAQLWLVP